MKEYIVLNGNCKELEDSSDSDIFFFFYKRGKNCVPQYSGWYSQRWTSVYCSVKERAQR